MYTLSIVLAVLASVASSSGNEIVCQSGKGFAPTTIKASMGVNGMTPVQFYEGSIGSAAISKDTIQQEINAAADSNTIRGNVDFGVKVADMITASIEFTSPSTAVDIPHCTIDGKNFCMYYQVQPNPRVRNTHWIQYRPCNY